MGPLPGFFGLRGAIGVAVGEGWVFRVFIGSWVDYRDVYGNLKPAVEIL